MKQESETTKKSQMYLKFDKSHISKYLDRLKKIMKK